VFVNWHVSIGEVAITVYDQMTFAALDERSSTTFCQKANIAQGTFTPKFKEPLLWIRIFDFDILVACSRRHIIEI